jgi:hypothetical protein
MDKPANVLAMKEDEPIENIIPRKTLTNTFEGQRVESRDVRVCNYDAECDQD